MLEEQVLTCFTGFTGTKVRILTAEEAALAAMLEKQVLTCFTGTKVLAYWYKRTNTDS
jgi:hypothetical protein